LRLAEFGLFLGELLLQARETRLQLLIQRVFARLQSFVDFHRAADRLRDQVQIDHCQTPARGLLPARLPAATHRRHCPGDKRH
jgi:hypothetical protein